MACASAANLFCTGMIGVGSHETCFIADFGVCHSSAGLLGVEVEVVEVVDLFVVDAAITSLICASHAAFTLCSSEICLFNSVNCS